MNIELDEISLPDGVAQSIKSGVLVLDVGGTNTRMLLVVPGRNDFAVGKCLTKECSSVQEAISQYLSLLNYTGAIETVVLGVAGKVDKEKQYVNMTNAKLEIYGAPIQELTGAKNLLFMNDAEIVAFSAPLLTPGVDTVQLHGDTLDGELSSTLTMFVACSTGVGTGFWMPDTFKGTGSGVGHATESGHMTCSYIPEVVRQSVSQQLQKPDYAITYEDILAGDGIERIYKSLGGVKNLSAEQIMIESKNGDVIAVSTVDVWANAFGMYLRDTTLSINAERIIFMGSVLEKNVDVLKSHLGLILEKFKGDPTHIFQLDLPLEVTTHRYLPLLGALQAAANFNRDIDSLTVRPEGFEPPTL